MNNRFDFTNKRILVTGASGGIGSAVCRMLDGFGASLYLLDYSEEQLKELKNSLFGSNHQILTVDLSAVDSLESQLKTLVKEFGAVDGFVHCAGIGAVRPLNISKYDFMLRVMNINYFSFVEIIRCLTKKGQFNPGMNIVGISAIGAYLGNATKTAYCASKSAMNSAVRCLAKELSPKGIRLNNVAPGVTNTAMASNFEALGLDSPETKAIADRQYLGPCEPDDIADAVLFLLSGMSRKITGSCISVDGGKLSC